jgi:RND superfamily putative drug exporter
MHPRRTWVLPTVGLGIAAAFLPTLKASGIGDDDVFLSPTESIDGLAIYEQHFTAGEASPIEMTAAESSWEEGTAVLQGIGGITTAYPLTPSAISGRPSLEPESPVVIDGRVAINAVTEVNSSSQEAKDLIRVVRDAVHEVDPSALVGGTAAINLDVNLTTERDLTVIVPLVLLVILVVLILLLRSIVAPLVIVAANVLSFAATLGVSAIVFNHVLRHPGSDSVVPLYGFVFLVALGVDYSIFLMSRGREEALQRGTRKGIRRALAVTGGVITSAGIVLAATFGAMAVLPILFMVQLAFIVAVGVLIDTLVVRTLLLPGLIHDLGRRSWWPWAGKIRD